MTLVPFFSLSNSLYCGLAAFLININSYEYLNIVCSKIIIAIVNQYLCNVYYVTDILSSPLQICLRNKDCGEDSRL